MSFVLALLELVPLIVQGFADAKEVFDWGHGVVKAAQAEGRDPTPAEEAELARRITELRTRLHSDDT